MRRAGEPPGGEAVRTRHRGIGARRKARYNSKCTDLREQADGLL